MGSSLRTNTFKVTATHNCQYLQATLEKNKLKVDTETPQSTRSYGHIIDSVQSQAGNTHAVVRSGVPVPKSPPIIL